MDMRSMEKCKTHVANETQSTNNGLHQIISHYSICSFGLLSRICRLNLTSCCTGGLVVKSLRNLIGRIQFVR